MNETTGPLTDDIVEDVWRTAPQCGAKDHTPGCCVRCRGLFARALLALAGEMVMIELTRGTFSPELQQDLYPTRSESHQIIRRILGVKHE